MSKVIKLIINDGLGFSSGFVSPAEYSCVIYARVPDKWIENGELKKGKEELFFENMYGRNWRLGNEDGSYYVVRNFEIQIPGEEQIWLQDNHEDRKFRYWYYHISDAEEFKGVKVAEF